jgi:hypothetical protein
MNRRITKALTNLLVFVWIIALLAGMPATGESAASGVEVRPGSIVQPVPMAELTGFQKASGPIKSISAPKPRRQSVQHLYHQAEGKALPPRRRWRIEMFV